MNQQNTLHSEQLEGGLYPYYQSFKETSDMPHFYQSNGLWYSQEDCLMQLISSDKFNLTGYAMSEVIPFDDNYQQFCAQSSEKEYQSTLRMSPRNADFRERNYQNEQFNLFYDPLEPLSFERQTKFPQQSEISLNQETQQAKLEQPYGCLYNSFNFNSSYYNYNFKPTDSFCFEEIDEKQSFTCKVDNFSNLKKSLLQSNNSLKEQTSQCKFLPQIQCMNPPSLSIPLSSNIQSLKLEQQFSEQQQQEYEQQPKQQESEQQIEQQQQQMKYEQSQQKEFIKQEGQKESIKQESITINHPNSENLKLNKKRKNPAEYSKKTTKKQKIEIICMIADSNAQEQLGEETRFPNEEEDSKKDFKMISDYNIETSEIKKPSTSKNKERERIKNEVNQEESYSLFQNTKKTKPRSSRQSQHKNVYKNFGKELLRFVKSKKGDTRNCVLNEEEYSILLEYLTGGLNEKDTKKTLPIQKKESLQTLWTIEDCGDFNITNINSCQLNNIQIEINFQIQECDDIQTKIKKYFKQLSWEFFSNHAYLYVMQSRKLDKKEIHLKCIRSFLEGILCPKSLETFRPI